MTSKFESSSGSAATATISLPQPVPAHGGGRDPEEGEISDGVEEGEEVFSDISDEELESNYGRSGMRRGVVGSKVAVVGESKENQLISPSSESKSIVKNGEHHELPPDDYEDVDEDILYLRLMALRSMIPSSDIIPSANKQSPVSSSKSIEDEMKELLEEADKAAAAQSSSIPPPPIIDIADSDEEKMDLYMKTMTTNMSFLAPIPTTKVKEEDGQQHHIEGEPNLQYLVMKLKHSLEENNGVLQQEDDGGSVYSPTQSPVQLSPPSSPEMIPLPPEGILKPPGDDEYVGTATKTVACSSSGAHQPVDMELGSENEAEIQFFKHQKEIPSVNVVNWSQQQAQIVTIPPALGHPQMLYNCDHYLYQESMYQEEQSHLPDDTKKNDLLKAVASKPPPPPSNPPPTNSTPVLTKNKKRMRKRKSTSTIKCSINSSDEEESSGIVAGVHSKKRATPPPIVLPLEPIDSEDEEAMRAHLLSTMAAKRNAQAKIKKKEEIQKQPPSTSKEIPKVKPVLKKKSSSAKVKKGGPCSSDLGLTTEMPFDKLKKYFPNMVRPFIIPLNIPTTSSEDDESTSTRSNITFQANLDLLMKNAREGTLPPKVKRVPPPKPVRKNPPRSKATSTALLLTNKSTHPIRRKRHISLIEKESLKTRSCIEHLPIERQKEYKMLLARIAMKEKKQQQQIESKEKEETVEDPEEMRRLLLSKMKNLKSKIDLKKKVLIESKENSEPKNREETSPLPLVVHERVLASEKEVIASRNDVVNGLFKLSAQLSQFRNESEKLITAQNFLSDLLKQVEETRKLIKKKEERITQLRNVVKLSHLSISKKRKDLNAKESKCKKLGDKLIGESYQLPETGTDQIKQKLVQIASNAKLCKKANRDSASCNSANSSTTTEKDEEDGGPKTSELSGVSSSIAHLRSGGGEHGIDPHREFCRFELLGKCNDDACPYQHHKSVS